MILRLGYCECAAVTQVCEYLCKSLLSVLLGVFLEVALLGHLSIFKPEVHAQVCISESPCRGLLGGWAGGRMLEAGSPGGGEALVRDNEAWTRPGRWVGR